MALISGSMADGCLIQRPNRQTQSGCLVTGAGMDGYKAIGGQYHRPRIQVKHGYLVTGMGMSGLLATGAVITLATRDGCRDTMVGMDGFQAIGDNYFKCILKQIPANIID